MISNHEYDQLRNSCDLLLTEPDAGNERLAISWLHILRPHPHIMRQYILLFANVSALERFVYWFLEYIRSIVSFLISMYMSFRFTKQHWSPDALKDFDVDFVFVTHLVDKNQLKSGKDYYHGTLPETLASRGYKVLVAFVNQIRTTDLDYGEQWRSSPVVNILFPLVFSTGEEIRIYKGQVAESNLLKSKAQNCRTWGLKQIILQAAQKARCGDTRQSLRLGMQIGELVARVNPVNLVITHEGHAWERLAFKFARRAKPGIRCIGYLHSCLFPMQHAVFRTLGSGYNPNVVFASGLVSKRQYESRSCLRDTQITVTGSPKHRSVSRSPEIEMTGITCLVLPEGFISECNLLFEFSLSCARQCPEIMFVWRLHPLVSFKELIGGNRKLRNLPSNVRLSSESIDQDVSKSNLALYRGSTAIVNAVTAGLLPLYLEIPGEVSIDPIYELVDWKRTVGTVEDFIQVVSQIDNVFSAEDNEYKAQAQRYCEEFYTQIDADAVISIVGKPSAKHYKTPAK